MTPVVVVTGLSGSGKASILRALEDLGYEAVDNPPLTMVESLVGRGGGPLAIGLDARTRGFDVSEALAALERLRNNPALRVRLVYAWADTHVLLRRFTETRRRHPLALHGGVADGVETEAALLEPLRRSADMVLDTSELPLPGLRRLVDEHFGLRRDGGDRWAPMTVTLMSFGFPAGLPREADMVFDARFLKNPHYCPILKPKTGCDRDVAAYVESDVDFAGYFDGIRSMLALVLPRFVQEGKKYATIAVGCTGGRHRSVRIVEKLAPLLERASGRDQGWQVRVVHRELTEPLSGAVAGKG